MKNLFPFSLVLICTGIIISASSISSCNVRTREATTADSLLLFTENSEIYYNLREPDDNYRLPAGLDEVSALSYSKQGHLLMVDDERGSLFTYDLQKRDIIHQLKFAKPGDYEGVEAVGDDVYALRSDGKLYKFKYSSAVEVESEEIDTPLEEENNTEGLGYDPERQLLMIACKNDGDYDGNKAHGRAVYGFDIKAGEMLEKELFAIDSKDLEEYYEKVKGGDYDEDRFRFHPSAIAYHPIEKTFYVLAYEGHLLLVVNRKGQILSSYPVPSKVVEQPEGICFSPEGDMFISSEGNGGRGYVARFKMRRH